MTKRKMLADQFGSRKRQRIINSNISNMVNLQGDDTSLSVLDHAIEGHQQEEAKVKEEQGDTSSAEAPVVARLPPHDKTATTPSTIYDLAKMVDKETWAALDAKLFISLAKKPSEVDKHKEAGHRFSGVVLAGLPTLKSLKDKADKKRVARYWACLQHMMNFHLMSRNKKAETLAQNTSIPEGFKEWLLAAFTVREVKKGAVKDDSYSTPCQASLLCHMCVVLLAASGYHLGKKQLDVFARDLKMTTTNLLSYFREVGCTKASTERVELTAPLQLPSLEKRKARGKR